MAVVSFDLGPRPEVTVANPRELAKVLQRAAEVAIALSEATGTLDDVSDGSTKVGMTPAERTKLSGIETGATADQTGAEIKALYEAQADTNAYTDAEKIKLAGVESGATADQTGAEILAAWESETGIDTEKFGTYTDGFEVVGKATSTTTSQGPEDALLRFVDADGVEKGRTGFNGTSTTLQTYNEVRSGLYQVYVTDAGGTAQLAFQANSSSVAIYISGTQKLVGESFGASVRGATALGVGSNQQAFLRLTQYNSTTRVGEVGFLGGTADLTVRSYNDGGHLVLDAYDSATALQEAIRFDPDVGLGFNGATPVSVPDITGSRGGNAALANLLTALESMGLITDSTT